MSDQANGKRAADEKADRDGLETSADREIGERGEAAGQFAADHEAFLRLARENEELKDRGLRLAAEMENLRRRTARDVHDARAYAIANFARDMLMVSDNLRRAIEAVPADAAAKGEAGLNSLLEGVEMTERAMLSTLERHGVKKIDPAGEKFDPNFHQAMFEVPNPDVPANTVVQVVQTGYVIGDRVLRPAMVGVARGGPKQASPAPADPGAPEPQAGKDA